MDPMPTLKHKLKFDMNLMRKLRREGFFKNSMINEIEAESRIPDSFKNRIKQKPLAPVSDSQVQIKFNQVSSDEEKVKERRTIFTRNFVLAYAILYIKLIIGYNL